MSCMLPASGGCCLCGPEAGQSFLAADHSPSPSEEGRPGGPLRASSSTHCPAPGGFTSGSDLHNTHPVRRPANHRASSMSCQSVMLWSWTFHTFVPLYWWRPPWVRLQRNLKIKEIPPLWKHDHKWASSCRLTSQPDLWGQAHRTRPYQIFNIIHLKPSLTKMALIQTNNNNNHIKNKNSMPTFYTKYPLKSHKNT